MQNVRNNEYQRDLAWRSTRRPYTYCFAILNIIALTISLIIAPQTGKAADLSESTSPSIFERAPTRQTHPSRDNNAGAGPDPALLDEQFLRPSSQPRSLVILESSRTARAQQQEQLRREPQPSPVERLPALSREIDVLIIDQSIEETLNILGQITGSRITLTAAIDLDIQDRQYSGTLLNILNQMAVELGLFWFTDGAIIYVSGIDEFETRVFQAPRSAPSQLFPNAVDDAGLDIYIDRFQFLNNGRTALVTGPENFLSFVETIFQSIQSEDGATIPGIRIIKYGQPAQ